MPPKYTPLTDQEIHERIQQALWHVSYCSGLSAHGQAALDRAKRELISLQYALTSIMEQGEQKPAEAQRCVQFHEGPILRSGENGWLCQACGRQTTPEETRKALAIKTEVSRLMYGPVFPNR